MKSDEETKVVLIHGGGTSIGLAVARELGHRGMTVALHDTARPTLAAELYADTLLGRMSIPDLGVEKEIDRDYALGDAKEDMREAFAHVRAGDDAFAAGFSAGANGQDMQIVYAERFAMLDDRGRRGRTIRLRAQLAAGLLRAG